MSDVLELVHVDNSKVVVKFKELSNFDKALNPWVLPNADYITITRGKRHIMTVITKDGKSWSINWGEGGVTMISDSLLESRRQIVSFIEKECLIPIDLTISNDEITEASVFYNQWFTSWQVQLRGEGYGQEANIWDRSCNNEYDAIDLANKFIGVHTWRKGTAQTGIDIWRANI